MTVEEVMFQSLASIASFYGTAISIPTTNAIHPSNYRSKVLIVGSYRDKVTNEEFEREDQLLQERIKSTDFYKEDMMEKIN